MRILTVVGNRPQFIKAAAVSGPLRARHEEILVHTGQHHDDSLSRVFFAELGLARPEHELGIAGGSNTSQTSRMLAALEPLLAHVRPDATLVYGDTNSTLAGALAAAQAGDPGRARRGGHALVRPHDARGAQPRAHRPPRRAAAVLLRHRRREPPRGVRRRRRRGRRRRDGRRRAALAARRARDAREIPAAYGLEPGSYLLLTAHRAGNVDDPERLRALVELVQALPRARAVPRSTPARARACRTPACSPRCRRPTG